MRRSDDGIIETEKSKECLPATFDFFYFVRYCKKRVLLRSKNVALQSYIQQKLAELEQGKELNNMVMNGRISFGIDSKNYGHLPAWKELVQSKKKMLQWIWIEAFFLSVMITGTVGGIWEKFETNWLKALLGLLLLSSVIMLFYVILSFYNLFFRFRKTEQEVRKIIYQDILERLKKDETI